MRTLLIYQEDGEIDREIIARWLASFSDLAGIVILRERRSRIKTRIKREIKRVGYLRFLDVMAFRFYYKLFLAKKDDEWRLRRISEFHEKYPKAVTAETLITHSPNSPEAQEFIAKIAPDVVIARCKTLLARRVFSIPTIGTFVFHPGICPEYRNAHGCFWALAEQDYDNVGMTLLKIDDGIDTGPVYGYYSYDYDAQNESHIVIQTRVVIDNLERLRSTIEAICAGEARPLETNGRGSNVWGQPWLTKYRQIIRNAKNLNKQLVREEN